MSEMVDRVAKSIWRVRRAIAADQGIHLEEWGDGSIPRANHVFAEARAAIEAMRDPTVAMLSYETSDAMVHPDCFTCGGHLEGWRLMIDAALDTPSQITPHVAGS